MKVFRNPYWNGEISQIVSVVSAVSNIIKRENFVEMYKSSIQGAANKDISDDVLEMVGQMGEQAENAAGEIFISQMVVLLVTYLELMIQEYFEVLFAKHPLRMYEYLFVSKHGVDIQGKVDLNEIAKAESKDEIIDNLSEIAAINATSGKFKTILSRLEKSSKSKLREIQRENLLNLVNHRNKIVHEAFRDENDQDDFMSGYVAVVSFLSTLIEWCEINGLPHGSIA